MDRPFLQTPEWLAFQQHLGRTSWRLDDGFASATIIRHDVRFGQHYLAIPYGPELNLDAPTNGLRNSVLKLGRELYTLGKEQGSMFVKLEPMHDMVPELMIREGVRLYPSGRSMQPRATMVMDLAQSEDELTNHLHHKHRYNIALAERKGVSVQESRDAEAFWTMLQKTSEHDDFRTHGKLYYKKLLNFFTPTSSGASGLTTRLYFAYHGGQPIAGVIILEHGKTAYYLHGASDRTQRALMGPHLLHWTLIKQYKAAGFSWYDFWGVDAAKWPGVTRFKLGFGGRVIEYPGSFDLVLKPFWYWLYKMLPR